MRIQQLHIMRRLIAAALGLSMVLAQATPLYALRATQEGRRGDALTAVLTAGLEEPQRPDGFDEQAWRGIISYAARIAKLGGDSHAFLLGAQQRAASSLPPYNPERALDRIPAQWQLLTGKAPLQFGPGLLYYGVDDTEALLGSGYLPAGTSLARTAYEYGALGFRVSARSPGIVVVPTEVFNRYLRREQAVLPIRFAPLLPEPYPKLTVPVPLSEVLAAGGALLVGEGTYIRYQRILQGAVNGDVALQSSLQAAASRLHAIVGLHESSLASAGGATRALSNGAHKVAIGQHVLRQNLLVRTPRLQLFRSPNDLRRRAEVTRNPAAGLEEPVVHGVPVRRLLAQIPPELDAWLDRPVHVAWWVTDLDRTLRKSGGGKLTPPIPDLLREMATEGSAPISIITGSAVGEISYDGQPLPTDVAPVLDAVENAFATVGRTDALAQIHVLGAVGQQHVSYSPGGQRTFQAGLDARVFTPEQQLRIMRSWLQLVLARYPVEKWQERLRSATSPSELVRLAHDVSSTHSLGQLEFAPRGVNPHTGQCDAVHVGTLAIELPLDESLADLAEEMGRVFDRDIRPTLPVGFPPTVVGRTHVTVTWFSKDPETRRAYRELAPRLSPGVVVMLGDHPVADQFFRIPSADWGRPILKFLVHRASLDQHPDLLGTTRDYEAGSAEAIGLLLNAQRLQRSYRHTSLFVGADGVRFSIADVERETGRPWTDLRAASTGLEEPWLGGLRRAADDWMRQGLAIDPGQAKALIAHFRYAMSRRGASIHVPARQQARRAEFLTVVSAVFGALANPADPRIVHINASHPPYPHAQIAYLDYHDQGKQYLVRIEGEVAKWHPRLSVSVKETSPNQAIVGTLRMGRDLDPKHGRHLDIADTGTTTVDSWVPHRRLDDVWASDDQAMRFVKQFFHQYLQPRLQKTPSASTGLEEKAVPMTAAEAIAHAKAAGMVDERQLVERLLTLRGLRAGQSSLHLGSGESGLPAAEGFFGLNVDMVNLTTSGTASVKALYDRYRRETRIGGTMTAYYADVRLWVLMQEKTKQWNHIVLIDLFTANRQRWAEADSLFRWLVRHTAPGGTILISGLGRKFSGHRMPVMLSAASRLDKELKRQNVKFTKRNITGQLPLDVADTELWLFRLAPSGLEEMSREEMIETLARWVDLGYHGPPMQVQPPNMLLLAPSAVSDDIRLALVHPDLPKEVFWRAIVWTDDEWLIGRNRELRDRGLRAGTLVVGSPNDAVTYLGKRAQARVYGIPEELEALQRQQPHYPLQYVGPTLNLATFLQELYQHLLRVPALTPEQSLEAERLARAITRYL